MGVVVWLGAMRTGQQERSEGDTGLEAARERSAVPHPREILNIEHDRLWKGHERNIALKKWGPEVEFEILRDLELGF
jgi:hypothetical protein